MSEGRTIGETTEKQKAIRHDLNRLCRVLSAGRRSGRGPGRRAKGDPGELGVSDTYLPGARGQHLTLLRGIHGEAGAIKEKLRGLRPQWSGRERLGSVTVLGPGVQKNLYGLYPHPPRSINKQFRGRRGRQSGGTFSAPILKILLLRSSSFKIQTPPKRCPLPRRSRVKSLFSRHPQPGTHPAVVCETAWVPRQARTRKKDGFYGPIL